MQVTPNVVDWMSDGLADEEKWILKPLKWQGNNRLFYYFYSKFIHNLRLAPLICTYSFHELSFSLA